MGTALNRACCRKISIGLILVLGSLRLWGAAAEFYVCPDCELTSIQTTIDAAPEGSTIRVGPGVYREETILIKKNIRLLGEGSPILDGQNNRQIMAIFKSNKVTVSGFVFKNTGVSFTAELAGLRVIESTQCNINENRFINATYGIYLEKSHQCQITHNQFSGQAKDESSGGNGIHIWTGSEHKIENNTITGHRDGIYLEFVKSSTINKNNVSGNLRYGLHFMFSNSTHCEENQFYENGSGVAIMYSQDIVMKRNQYLRNIGNASYGLLLKDINSSQFSENQFAGNTVAIYMEGSNRSQFQKNQFEANGYGLRIMGNCENNKFTENNFITNSFDVTTNSSMSWNEFIGNYWSKYTGYDLDHDQVGDVPFRPVSLSSVVIESIDSSFYLIGSFLFDLLNFVERALPELTPETLKDEMPLMVPSKVGLTVKAQEDIQRSDS